MHSWKTIQVYFAISRYRSVVARAIISIYEIIKDHLPFDMAVYTACNMFFYPFLGPVSKPVVGTAALRLIILLPIFLFTPPTP